MNQQATQQEALDQLISDFDAALQPVEDQIHAKEGTLEQRLRSLDQLRAACEQAPFLNLLALNIKESRARCTRIASLYALVLGDFTVKFDLPAIQLVCVQKRFINQVFEASGYSSLESLLGLIRRKAVKFDQKKNQGYLANPAHVRDLLITPLAEVTTESLVSLSLEEGEVVALITLGLLLDRAPLSVTGEANRIFLLEQFNPFEHLPCDARYRHLIANVWMLCSYSTAENKHEVKKHLNAWFERYFKSRNIAPKQKPKIIANSKPTLVMVAESFRSQHAMFRWYGPLIKQMRADYHMVLLALPADVDDESKALFDEFIEVPSDELGLQTALNSVSPDIVYFPSVGMRAWSIALANLRWAPLQIMSLGHPATSHSRHMDVCLCGDRLFGGQAYFSENVMVLNTEIGNLAATHKNMALPGAPELLEDEIRVAVPCHVMKLNFRFIAALKEIERLAEKPVRFTFFPNEHGAAHVSTAQRLHHFFPNAVVARRTGYENYLQILNQHHLALSPFPFGNASSIIDCLVLNLPIVGMIGGEPHARSDYTVLGAFGLDEYLVANSEENYVLGAVRYINQPELLAELRNMVASKNVLNTQFNDDNTRPDEIRRAIAWAWANHEKLQETRATTYTSEGRW